MANSYKEALQQAGLVAQAAPAGKPASYQEALSRAGLSGVDAVPKDQFGESRPRYADGGSSVTPINESPLSVSERFNLALGDSKGNHEWIKSKFKDVKQNKNGDYTVLDADGRWKRLDPSGSSGDPWELTKDIADAAPTVLKLGASIGAAVLSGGASIPAQLGIQATLGAVSSLAQTSMGRLVNTYSDDPMAQVQDMALETLFNAAGVIIPLGAKYAKEALPKLLGTTLNAIGKASPEAQQGLTSIMSTFSGVTEKALQTGFAYADDVAKVLKESLVGRNATEAMEYIKSGMFPTAKRMLQGVDDAVGEIFEHMQNTVSHVVPKDQIFGEGLDALHSNFQKVLLKKGLGTVKDGKFSIKPAREVWDDLAKASGKASEGFGLEKEAVGELLFKINQNMAAMSKAKFLPGRDGYLKMLGIRKEIKLIQKQLAGIAKVTENGELVGLVKDIGRIAEPIMTKNFTFNVPVDLKVAWGPKMVEKLSGLRSTLDEAIVPPGGMTNNPLASLDRFYDMAEAASSQAKQAVAAGSQPGAIESFMNQLSSASKTRVMARTDLEKIMGVIEAGNTYTGTIRAHSALINNSAQRLKVANSAASFTPWARPGLVGTQAGVAATSGAITGAMSDGNQVGAGLSGFGATMALGGALTSPRLAFTAIKSLMAARGLIGQLAAKGGKDAFLKTASATPGMMDEFVSTIHNGPAMANQTYQSMVKQSAESVFNRPVGMQEMSDMLRRKVISGPPPGPAPSTNPYKRGN